MSNWQNFTAPNMGLLFYKKIYKDLVTYFKEEKNQDALEIKDEALQLRITEKQPEFDIFYNDLYEKELASYKEYSTDNLKKSFSLYTTYPGLLLGSGYTHSGGGTGDFKIGFYFDYTTGLPVIPGSSLKGVLRNAFEIDLKDKKNITGEKSVELIKYFLNEITHDKTSKNEVIASAQKLLSTLDIDALNTFKEKVFGIQKQPGEDIFFDAVIDKEKTKANKFISSDFITPHHPNLLKNPKPLQFLKVLPNVAFCFRFNLSVTDEWSIKIKEALFMRILLMFGIGAKTNVGYGQFSLEPITVNITEAVENNFIVSKKPGSKQQELSRQQQEDLAEENRLKNKNQNKPLQQNFEKIKILPDETWLDLSAKLKGETINATVVAVSSGSLTVQPHVHNCGMLKVNGKSSIGYKVKVRVMNVTGLKNEQKNTLTLEIDKNKLY